MNAVTASHKPTMNLRFVLRDGKRILQQMFVPEDWNRFKEYWRDIELREEREGDDSSQLEQPIIPDCFPGTTSGQT